MNLNWSTRVIKHVLLGFNLLFVISGIILIAVGVSVKAYYTQYNIFLSDSYFSLPNLLIATGSLIFFIAFFGCCGAYKESWLLILIFSFLLGLIFILELSAGIAGYVLRGKTTSYLTRELTESLKEYTFYKPNKEDSVSPKTIMWDTIQYEFECCGAVGPADWEPYAGPKTTVEAALALINGTKTALADPPVDPIPDPKYNLPGSCCRSTPGASGTLFCNTKISNTTTYFKKGCVTGFGDYLKSHAVTLGGLGIAISFIQLFAVIFACRLAKQIKQSFYST